MIPPMLAGPLFGAAGMALAGVAFWGWLVLVHDPAVRAEQVATIAAAVAVERAAMAAASIVALERQAAESAELVARVQSAKERIAHAGPSQCTVAPPALRAVFLRQPGATGGPPR